jgi:hypothetical protein
MKKTIMILTVAAGLAIQAMAANSDNSTSASSKGIKALDRIYQSITTKTVSTDKIERYGNISSRPWAQTVGWAQQSTQFAGDQERFHEPHFNLFWLGATPK